MQKVVAIVAAAGRGVRLKSRVSKPLIILDKKPLIAHTLSALNRVPGIKAIIVAAHPKDIAKIRRVIKDYRLTKVKKIILGGATRRRSVENALKEIPAEADLVLVHDAARPFIEKDIVLRAIKAACRYKASVVAVKVKSTLKEAKNSGFFVERTINRANIWEIQTPQVFKKDIILKAYRKFKGIGATDDAYLVERLGVKIKIIQGSYFNIKITTAEDLVFAKAILNSKSTFKG